MSRLHTSFVLGYHGCGREVGENVLSGKSDLKKSDSDYDWLGPGIYFWEADPKRAYEWAQEKAERANFEIPFVIGAVIDLGNCLDLMSRDNLDLLKGAYGSLVAARRKGNLGPLPKNGPVFRRRDCAVISHLHRAMSDAGEETFDTVRGLFSEGKPIYRGGGFLEKTHIQIAACNLSAVKGVFRVPETDYT